MAIRIGPGIVVGRQGISLSGGGTACAPLLSVAAPNSFQSWDLGVSDFVVAADMDVPGTGASGLLLVRYASFSPGTYARQSYNVSNGLGALTIFLDGTTMASSGNTSGWVGQYRIAFVCSGNTISVYRDRLLKASLTDTWLSSNTRIMITETNPENVSNLVAWPLSCAAEEVD